MAEDSRNSVKAVLRLSSLFNQAFATICSALDMTPQTLMDELSRGLDIDKATARQIPATGAVLFIGGDTLIGKAMIQIVSLVRPSLFILSTIGPHKDKTEQAATSLCAVGIQQCSLGAKYSIDHGADDLDDDCGIEDLDGQGDDEDDMDKCGAGHLLDRLQAALEAEHLKSVDLIIDAMGNLGGRPESFLPLVADDRNKIINATVSNASASLISESNASGTDFLDELLMLLLRIIEHERYRLPEYLEIETYQFDRPEEAVERSMRRSKHGVEALRAQKLY